jgi:hypothetical protein
MNSNNIDIILKSKINDLGHFLINNTENDTKKKEIQDALIDIPTYKILLFVSFIDKNKIDLQINDFIKLFQIKDTEDIRNTIKTYIDYFIEVKQILNS